MSVVRFEKPHLLRNQLRQKEKAKAKARRARKASGTLELSICGDALTTAGARASLWIKGADPGAPLLYALSPFSVPTPISPTETLVPAWPPALLGFGLVANAYGQVQLPLQAAGPGVTTWIIQSGALNANGFDLSNAVSLQLGL